MISAATFIHGIFYLVSLSLHDSSYEVDQSVGIAGLIFLLLGVFGFILASGLFKENYTKRITILAISIQISLFTTALTTVNMSMVGAISLLVFLLISNIFFSGRQTVLFVLFGLIGGFLTVVINSFSPTATG